MIKAKILFGLIDVAKQCLSWPPKLMSFECLVGGSVLFLKAAFKEVRTLLVAIHTVLRVHTYSTA
jgi:hypothetical protein